MAVITLLAALAAQSAATVNEVPVGAEHVDVAYEELVKRQPSAAIERIRANTDIASDDPAALINLGTAYAMLGDNQKAEEYYRSAIASDMRYDLQLADGRWMDSRLLARMAVAALAKGQVLAQR